MTGFDSMGITNNYWGICGFNSSLYALYTHNPKMRAKLETGATTPTQILAEIKTFLRMLQADGETDIIDEIEAFTRTFKGFEDFTVEGYINRINSVVSFKGDVTTEKKFSIGMPPGAVIRYLRKMCGFGNATIAPMDTSVNELVVGLYRDDGDNMHTYGGLRHYVYYLSGTYYSWGKQFASIEQMGMRYQGICYKIAL